ncbi:sugar diacid recognition domain-containing protein [Mycoplasmatota bacterium WC44]
MVGLANEVVIDIAMNLSKLFKHNVDIFDIDGKIVGSGDISRIGQYHSLVHSIINGENRNYKVFESSDEIVIPGINLPLYSNGKIIGAGGINGDPDEVEIFSEILKVSLESLLYQKITEDKKTSVQKYEKEVVLDILYNLRGFEEIDKRLSVIGFRKQKHNLLVKFLSTKYDYTKLFEGSNYLRAIMEGSEIYIFSESNQELLVEIKDMIVNQEMDSIISEIVEFENLKEEYNILNFIEQNIHENTNIYFTLNFKLNAFLDSIDYNKYDFYEAKNIINQDYLIKTFFTYIENNLSLIHSSEKLYIHLNTLKYRIKKIEELTGCCLHNVDDILRLKLSILALRHQTTHLS